jgi:hypothetical protein
MPLVCALTDNAPGFMVPTDGLKPFLRFPAATAAAPVWITGINIRTGFSFGAPQPPPVPAGWTNPNPGALALLWEASEGGGLQVRLTNALQRNRAMPSRYSSGCASQDVFFHPDSWPDNHRMGTGPNTELSLVIEVRVL